MLDIKGIYLFSLFSYDILRYSLLYSRAHITLKVECLTDGIWKFPITLIATEPEVEDVIDIQGIGLFKTAETEFRLTSQTR